MYIIKTRTRNLECIKNKTKEDLTSTTVELELSKGMREASIF